jgi:hypothetical protein
VTHPKSGKIARTSALLAAIALLASLPLQQAIADTKDTSLVKNREFAKVRRDLIKAGWKPVISGAEMNDGTPENRFGAARPMYDAGFVEVEYCSEGNVYCIFNYTRGGKCLQITTVGEYGKHNGKQYPLLQKWSDDCTSR